MPALDTVSWTVTQPNTGLAMTPVTGDSANVRNVMQGTVAMIAAAWTKAQAVGFTGILFPSGNDQTRNIRYRNAVNQAVNMMGRGVGTPVQPQETMTLFQAGSNTAGDVELAHQLMYYDSLPGGQARVIKVDELWSRVVRMVTVEDTITPTVASTYSGARALNAASDLLRANTDYAIVGASIGIACGALCVRGVDTANLRCSVPGQVVANDRGVNWFADLAEQYDLPMIPVINSANKAGIFTEVVQDENLTAVPFAWHLYELAAV
jgi:hypothetical protein